MSERERSGLRHTQIVTDSRRGEQPRPVSKSEYLKVKEAGDLVALPAALVGLVLHSGDWRWCQNECLELIEGETGLHRLASTCLGHLARLHQTLDLDVVVPVLRALRSAGVGEADDALDDIAMFIRG